MESEFWNDHDIDEFIERYWAPALRRYMEEQLAHKEAWSHGKTNQQEA